MMNIQNLLSQMMGASNPMQMLMGMIPKNQQNLINQFKGMTDEQQAERIAQLANEKGLSKQDLYNLINMLNGKK